MKLPFDQVQGCQAHLLETKELDLDGSGSLHPSLVGGLGAMRPRGNMLKDNARASLLGELFPARVLALATFVFVVVGSGCGKLGKRP